MGEFLLLNWVDGALSHVQPISARVGSIKKYLRLGNCLPSQRIFRNYETEVRASIPEEEYPEPVLTERVQDGIQPRSDQPFAQGYRQTRQQRRITYQQVIQLLESQKRNQRKEFDQLLDVKESEIDKLRDRVSQLEDNFDIALSELESKLTRSFRAEIDSKFGSIRNVGIDLDKGSVMIHKL